MLKHGHAAYDNILYSKFPQLLRNFLQGVLDVTRTLKELASLAHGPLPVRVQSIFVGFDLNRARRALKTDI
jgi:hypothetical protein